SKKLLPTLRIATSAGEALPARIAMRFREVMGVDIIDGLGSTEMLHIYISQRVGQVRPGCLGQLVPGYEAQIVHEDGRQVLSGEMGDLYVKGPTCALGYWHNRPKSIDTFHGVWMRTSDKCSRDSDGWFTYGGRGDDMLKVGGIYVSPTEVEDALLSHGSVLEA